MYHHRRVRVPKRNARVRCRRSSETSSGHSSCSSSEVSSYRSVLHSDSGMSCMDLGSIAEHVFEELSIHGNTTSDTDNTETAAFSGDANKLCKQINDVTFQNGTNEAPTFVLNFNVSSAEDTSLYELFRQVLDWLDPDLDLFQPQTTRVSDNSKDKGYYSVSTLDIPSLAIVLFLQEDGSVVDSRAKQAKAFFNNRPWKVHHSEWVGGTVQMYPENSHDYYILTPDRPLCSVRQIHCGSEHLRIMRYVTSKHWKETMELYRLILDQHPNVLKKDFCLFTVSHFAKYDLQFALKKLPRGTVPKKTRKSELCFFISNIGSLVPLFPHPCHKITEVTWVTRDFDGNKIYLQVQPAKPQKRCRSVSPTKLMARTNRSAFSPVVPHKSRTIDDSAVQYASANMSLMDKLSPRVYVTKKANKSSIPLRPPSTSSRNSDSSTGVSSVSQDLDSNEFSHDHTDSGFVDDKLDSVSRDPRRTPIIGTHLSKFSHYDRYISTPNGEICLEEQSPEKEDLTPRAVVQPKRMSEQSLAWVESYVESQNQRITKITAPSPALSPRVTPTNRLPSPCLTPTNRMVSPCLTPTNRYVSPSVTPTNIPISTQKHIANNYVTENSSDVTQTVAVQIHSRNIPNGSMVSGSLQVVPQTCDNCKHSIDNQAKPCYCESHKLTAKGFPANSLRAGTPSPHTVRSYTVSPVKLERLHSDDFENAQDVDSIESTPQDANDADLLTPRCPSVDADSHDLQEYMKLRWGMGGTTSKRRSRSNTPPVHVVQTKAVVANMSSNMHEDNHSAIERLFGGYRPEKPTLPQGKPPIPPTKTTNRVPEHSDTNLNCDYINIPNVQRLHDAQHSKPVHVPQNSFKPDETLEHSKPKIVHNQTVYSHRNEHEHPKSTNSSNGVKRFINRFESLSVQENSSQDKPNTLNAYQSTGEQLISHNSIISSTHEQNEIKQTDTTLGQFLSQNKAVSEFLLKRSPNNSPNHDENEADYVNLPDLVKRNGFRTDTTKLENAKVSKTINPIENSNTIKEGTPEDLGSSADISRSRFNSNTSDASTLTSNSVFSENDSSLQSCISKQGPRIKKRVRISEINNTHHLYEAGQEHGFELADIYDDNSDEFDDIADVDNDHVTEFEADDVTQGCYNLKSGISTVYDMNNAEYSAPPTAEQHSERPTAEEYFVRPTVEEYSVRSMAEEYSVRPTMEEYSMGPRVETHTVNKSNFVRNTQHPVCEHNDSVNISNKSKANCDWQKIKQCPEVGFYI